ncbi:MAG: DUF5009 domain-containing protein [Alistipes sp.]|nr:DUF5009 domain-containing protein [Candidatus Minthomonas equi]
MENKTQQRLMSIDALRGFDMFWIMGGASLLVQICMAVTGSSDSELIRQMEHVDWGGLHFMDLIFPVFVFIAGLSYPFSHAKQIERGDTPGMMHKKIIRRMIILLLMGLAYNGFFKSDWTKAADFRYFSVLGKIGIAWGVAAFIYMHTKSFKARLGWIAAGLLGYSLLLCFTAPDAPAGASPTSLEGCFIGYLDRLFVPGYLYCDNLLEPSGPFVSFFGYPTALLGMCGGDIARSSKWTLSRKPVILALAGIACLTVGIACSPLQPIVKKLWSPTFALVASGIGFVFFALFFYLIDVREWRSWCFPFRLVGMNSITIYFLSACFDFGALSMFFFKSITQLCGPYALVAQVFALLVVKFVFLYFLYRKKIFLKV